MTRSRPTGLLIVVAVALLAVTAGAVAGTPSAGAAIDAPSAQLNDSAANSTAVPHERPDSVARDGNSSALERRLSVRLTDRLTRSATRIGDGEYEAAQHPVAEGAGYDAELALYVEVYRRAVSDDLQQVERREALFAETATLQVRYAQTLSEVERVRSEYEDARDAGDRDRARERARELNALTRELRRTDESLAVNYQNLSDTTPSTPETAVAAIDETTDETTRQTEAIVRQAYTDTELTARADSDGSFTDPVRITGELSASSEDPPTGNVSFLVNGQRQFGSVAPDGSFTLRYRPVTDPVGSASVDVAYVPDDSALFLGSSTNVTTTVVQETPTVSVRNATDSARATSPVTATGRVTADDVAVPNASVGLYVGEKRLAATRTNDDGEYAFEEPLPIDVETGTRTLSVRAGAADAAVGQASEERDLTVEESRTRVSLSAVRSEGSVSVSGRLTTASETAVGGQEVSISLGGERRRIVQTDADGNFEAVVELSEPTDESDSIPVRAAFDGSGMNLANSSVAGSLSPPGQGPLPDETGPAAAVVAGPVLLLAAGYGLYRYRSRVGEEGGPREGSTPPDSITPEEASPFVSPGSELADTAGPLDPVPEHLERGDARTAVLTLYAAVRRELGRGDETADTHWDFFESTADGLSADRRATLRDLTAAFEAVRFAGADPDPEAVRELATAARGLFEDPEDADFTDTSHTEDYND